MLFRSILTTGEMGGKNFIQNCRRVNAEKIQISIGDKVIIMSTDGNVGIGTTGPGRRLDVLHANSTPQLRVSQSGTVFSELYIDSAGDLRISATGKDIRVLDENLWVCSGGACPAGAPADTGNLIVEGKVGIGATDPGDKLDVRKNIIKA